MILSADQSLYIWLLQNIITVSRFLKFCSFTMRIKNIIVTEICKVMLVNIDNDTTFLVMKITQYMQQIVAFTLWSFDKNG